MNIFQGFNGLILFHHLTAGQRYVCLHSPVSQQRSPSMSVFKLVIILYTMEKKHLADSTRASRPWSTVSLPTSGPASPAHIHYRGCQRGCHGDLPKAQGWDRDTYSPSTLTHWPLTLTEKMMEFLDPWRSGQAPTHKSNLGFSQHSPGNWSLFLYHTWEH